MDTIRNLRRSDSDNLSKADILRAAIQKKISEFDEADEALINSDSLFISESNDPEEARAQLEEARRMFRDAREQIRVFRSIQEVNLSILYIVTQQINYCLDVADAYDAKLDRFEKRVVRMEEELAILKELALSPEETEKIREHLKTLGHMGWAWSGKDMLIKAAQSLWAPTLIAASYFGFVADKIDK